MSTGAHIIYMRIAVTAVWLGLVAAGVAQAFRVSWLYVRTRGHVAAFELRILVVWTVVILLAVLALQFV